jgi:hypothetical protein
MIFLEKVVEIKEIMLGKDNEDSLTSYQSLYIFYKE